jgi:GNAT superfamily N-acetyltransferase
VLRGGRADAVVTFEGDDEWETVHLAVIEESVDEAAVAVAVVTFIERECPVRPGTFPARQLRGMAVAADRQGEGLGAQLFAAGLARCRSDGAALVWANARVTAVPFYEANGMRAEGEVFDHPVGDGDLPHRTVVVDL